MKLKRLIIFLVVMCMLLATPVQAASAKRVKKSGIYSINLYSKKGVKVYLKNTAEEEEIPGAIKLFKKNKKKFYSKYFNYYDVSLIDIKLTKRALVGWGKLRCENNGKKKTYKFNKYKLKIAKNVKGYRGYRNSEYKLSKKKLFRKIKYSKGTNFYFYVSGGKVNKIVVY